MSFLSVIIPVYNAEKYLEESIMSILNQSFTDFELIIINDLSTDKSLEIIKKLKEFDHRIILINNEINSGPSKSRNKAIAECKGNYIAFMDADDIALPNRFEEQIKILNENPEIAVCGTWFTLFGEKIDSQLINHYENHDELRVRFLNECYIGAPTVMCRKEVFDNDLFNDEYIIMGDYELWTRLICKFQFYNIQKSLLNYRWHESNISHTSKINRNTTHKTIRFNQLKQLNILGNYENNIEYLLALNYEETKNINTLVKIFNAASILIKNNTELKIFSEIYFNQIIKENLTKIIVEKRKYSPKLLFVVLTKHYNVFNCLALKQKRRFIKRCLSINL